MLEGRREGRDDQMILPTIRESFGRRDALHLVELLGRDDHELRTAARTRLEHEGVDALLDDPRVLNALLTDPVVKAPPPLIFYVLIRQALLEGGIDSRPISDFVASLIVSFLRARRAYRISEDDEEEFHYLVDIAVRIGAAEERRAGSAREAPPSTTTRAWGAQPTASRRRARPRRAWESKRSTATSRVTSRVFGQP